MNRLSNFFAALLLITSSTLLAQSKAVEKAISDVADGVAQLEIYNGDNQPFTPITGLVVSKDGVIATSASAIEKATWIGVKIDEKEYFATDVAVVDEANDIALIRINATGLTPVNLNKTGTALKGKAVYELTNAGKEVSYSEGEAGKPEKVGKVRVLRASFKWTFNQNGGALLNAQGRLAGMISTKLGGAVPIALVKAQIRKLKNKSPLKILAQTKPVLGPEVKKTFYANGAIQSERTYLLDKLEGVSKFYTEDGKLAIEEMYKNNLRDGYSKEFYPNGKMRSEGNYTAGKKNGVFKTFYEDGNVESERTYQNDVVVGLIKLYTYYPSGALKEESTANTEGQLVGRKRIFFESGMLAVEENYANGKLDGVRRTYYDNGFLEKSQTWRQGFQFGDEKVFFPDGKRKEENKYSDAGVMVESKVYDERGRKIEDLDAGEIAERNRKQGKN
ncbi:MAG: trypsin-like peptidase domain-containing protein [Chlorobiales bacterium]